MAIEKEKIQVDCNDCMHRNEFSDINTGKFYIGCLLYDGGKIYNLEEKNKDFSCKDFKPILKDKDFIYRDTERICTFN